MPSPPIRIRGRVRSPILAIAISASASSDPWTRLFISSLWPSLIENSAPRCSSRSSPPPPATSAVSSRIQGITAGSQAMPRLSRQTFPSAHRSSRAAGNGGEGSLRERSASAERRQRGLCFGPASRHAVGVLGVMVRVSIIDGDCPDVSEPSTSMWGNVTSE